MHKNSYIDTSKINFHAWLSLLKTASEVVLFERSHFPNEKVKKECLSLAESLDEASSMLILKSLLFSTGSLGADDLSIKYLLYRLKTEKNEVLDDIKSNIHLQRLLYRTVDKKFPVWHGIDWVIDLLPKNPQMAIDSIYAYLVAHFWFLPDGRIYGFYDAMAFIRSRYLLKQHPKTSILGLSSRQFEHLIEYLYYRMDYETKLMRHTRDGGRDIIATKVRKTGQDKLLIQCKKVTSRIGVIVLRELYGVISSEKATKGVIVSTAGFTEPAKDFMEANQNRIELINFEDLTELFNRHFGSEWPVELERFILDSVKRHSET